MGQGDRPTTQHECPGCGKLVKWGLAFCALCGRYPNPAWDDYLRLGKKGRNAMKRALGMAVSA